MQQSNAIWIRMQANAYYDAEADTISNYFQVEDYSGLMECGNLSITGNTFRYNIGCPLQSGGLVYVQCFVDAY